MSNANIKSWAELDHAGRDSIADEMVENGLLVTVERFAHRGPFGRELIESLQAIPNRHLQPGCDCGCQALPNWEDESGSRLRAAEEVRRQGEFGRYEYQ